MFQIATNPFPNKNSFQVLQITNSKLLFLVNKHDKSYLFDLDKEQFSETDIPDIISSAQKIELGNQQILLYWRNKPAAIKLWDVKNNEIKDICLAPNQIGKISEHASYVVDDICHIVFNNSDSGADAGFGWNSNYYLYCRYDIQRGILSNYVTLDIKYLPLHGMVYVKNHNGFVGGPLSTMVELDPSNEKEPLKPLQPITSSSDTFRPLESFDHENILYLREQTDRRKENNYESEYNTTICSFNVFSKNTQVYASFPVSMSNVQVRLISDDTAIVFASNRSRLEISEFSLKSKNTTKLAELEPLSFIHSFIYNDHIYLVGGVNNQFKYSQAIYKMKIPSSNS